MLNDALKAALKGRTAVERATLLTALAHHLTLAARKAYRQKSVPDPYRFLQVINELVLIATKQATALLLGGEWYSDSVLSDLLSDIARTAGYDQDLSLIHI